MSDTAEFQGSSKVSLEGQTGSADTSQVAVSPGTAPSGTYAPGEADAEPCGPVYGPAPKPVAQPAIFGNAHRFPAHQSAAPQIDVPADTANQATTGSTHTSRTGFPSFSISVQRSTSSSMNRQASASQSPESPAPGKRAGEDGQGEHQKPEPDTAHGVSSAYSSGLNDGVTEGRSEPDQAAEARQFGSTSEAGADETVTISVESQCDSPSLNDIAEMDIADASREELMVYHSELMGWIRELESALQDCQADFKSHLKQYAQQEQLLERRTEELVTLQERHGVLGQEIDTQQKAHQRQTILVETLQGQLDSSQERVAQMERDFSQIQRRCSEQAQQLLQAEGLCRDLKSRLSRQQRHTMQFKAALEKSLAVSVSDNDYDLGDMELDAMDSSGELFPRPKPVRPWSDQLDAAAVNQALSGLESPSLVQQKLEMPTASPTSSDQEASSKTASLQLAFETQEGADIATEAAMAQMAYGNAAMGLVAPRAIADNPPAEPVFDPARAENLEAQLQQESEAILQGKLLGGSAAEQQAEGNRPGSHVMAGGNAGVAFVPPITPVLPDDQVKLSEQVESIPDRSLAEPSLNAGAEAGAVSVPTMTLESEKAEAKPKPTTLAGIDLPCFPKF